MRSWNKWTWQSCSRCSKRDECAAASLHRSIKNVCRRDHEALETSLLLIAHNRDKLWIKGRSRSLLWRWLRRQNRRDNKRKTESTSKRRGVLSASTKVEGLMLKRKSKKWTVKTSFSCENSALLRDSLNSELHIDKLQAVRSWSNIHFCLRHITFE